MMFFKNLLLIKLYIIPIILLFFTSASSAQKPRVAIMNFRANNTAKAYADVVRDILEVHLYKTNAFDIIERNQIDVILKEQGLENKYCSDTNCAIRIGKILSVDKVVIGSVNKVGKFTITIKFVNVREGLVEYADSEIARIEGVIEKAVNILAKRSSDKLTQGNIEEIKYTAQPNLSEYYFRGFMPGWAQFYAGRKTKGFIYLGSFILTGSFAIWSYWNYDHKKDAYERAELGTSRNSFDKKFDEYKSATNVGRISLGIFALAYVVNWVDVLFFSRPIIIQNENYSQFDLEDKYLNISLNNHLEIDKKGLEISILTKF